MGIAVSRRVQASNFVRWCSFAACFLTLLALAPSGAKAQATQGEWTFSAGPAYSAAPDFRGPARGPALSASAWRGISPVFSLGGGASAAWHYGWTTGPDDEDAVPGRLVWSTHAGISANLDVLAIIPFVSLSPAIVAGLDPENTSSIHPTLRAALGADYRPRRTFSAGALLEWHARLDDFGNFPHYALFSLRFSWILSPRAI